MGNKKRTAIILIVVAGTALTGGLFAIRNTTIGAIINPMTPKSGMLPGNTSDRIALSQAKSIAQSMDGLNGSSEKGQLNPAASQSNEFLIAQLSELPIHILRKAYDKKMEDIEKGAIGKRFKMPESASDRKHYRETLFSLLQEVVTRSDYWLARTSVMIAGDPLTTTFLLNFYDASHMDKEAGSLNIKEPKHLCWHLATFFGDEPSERWAGSSSCLESINMGGGGYYIVQMLNIDPVEATYSHVAAPLPLQSQQDVPFELLEAKAQRWRKMNRLDWTPLSHAEAEQVQKDHRKIDE